MKPCPFCGGTPVLDVCQGTMKKPMIMWCLVFDDPEFWHRNWLKPGVFAKTKELALAQARGIYGVNWRPKDIGARFVRVRVTEVIR